MSLEQQLRNTICSRGHMHPPWNTTGVLRIAKCESICGFCQKETKTAANLRKHVAIHIKNDNLNLTIAEGSSGRGKLEMPSPPPRSQSGSSSRVSPLSDDKIPHSPDSTPLIQASMSLGQHPPPRLPPPDAISSYFPSASLHTPHRSRERHLEWSDPQQYHLQAAQNPPFLPGISAWPPDTEPDHFRYLRKHNLTTKDAWTAIPAAEGSKILDLCRALSTTTASPHSASPPLGSPYGGGGISEPRIPCYNRETIYDEEWQAHMKNVHGVFLIWPETWMRRVEVLDLDAFGGDIAACNDAIIDS